MHEMLFISGIAYKYVTPYLEWVPYNLLSGPSFKKKNTLLMII